MLHKSIWKDTTKARARRKEKELRDHYGQYADRFYLVDAKEDKRKDYFAGKEGVVLTVNRKDRNIAPSALFAYHRKGVRLRLSTFSNGGVFFHY